MCLINVAHEHLITQTGKKSKPALINFMGPGAEGAEGRGPTYRTEGRGPRKTNAPKNEVFLLRISSVNVTKIRNFLRVWSHLPKKSLMGNLIFCAVQCFGYNIYKRAALKRISHCLQRTSEIIMEKDFFSAF